MAGRHFHRAFRQADVLTPLIGGIGLVAGAGVLWQLTRPEYPPYKLAARLKSLPASIRNGLGDDEYYCEETNATFPADKQTPGKLPDLSKHGNLLARVLKEKPSLYKYFREKITSNGVTLAKCIKPGIDNPGSEEGIIAGDEESYETFKELFDIVIDRLHRGYPAHARHNNDLDPYKITRTRIDTSGKYVLSCSVSAVRSIRGFNLPPSISFLDRRSVEKLATEAVGDLKGDLEGQYHPLEGSQSMSSKMKADTIADSLAAFTYPQSGFMLSAGIGRHWPDARGVFVNDSKDFMVEVNNTDHIKVISKRSDDDIKTCFAKLSQGLRSIQASLAAQDREFMRNGHLGYISTFPGKLGTGLEISVEMKIPNMIGRPDFEQVARKLGLRVDGQGHTGVFEGTRIIRNLDVLGRSEVNIVDTVIEGCAQLVEWEKALERGKDITNELPR